MPVSYCRPLGQNKIRYINIAILFFLKGILLYRKNSLCPKGKQYKNISIKRAFRLLDWNYHNLELWKIPRMINSSSQSERLRGLFPSGSLQEIKGGLSKQGWLREGAISEPISEADSVTAPDLPNQPADSASRGAAGEPRLHPALLPPTHILHVAAQTWTPIVASRRPLFSLLLQENLSQTDLVGLESRGDGGRRKKGFLSWTHFF